jgi:hypothetical protein
VTLEVDVDDGVPFRLVHVETHLVAQDAGVVDEHVEPAEGVDRLVHECFGAAPRRDAVVVRDRVAALRLDLVDHLLRGCGVGSFATRRAAEVVHDHRGTFGCEEQRVRTTDTAAGTGDDRDLAVEVAHSVLLVCFGVRAARIRAEVTARRQVESAVEPLVS